MTYREKRLPWLVDGDWNAVRAWKDYLEAELGLIQGRMEEVFGMPRLTAYGSNEGASNDAAAVVVVGPPPAGIVRKITLLIVHNTDTATAVINLSKRKGATDRYFGEQSTSAGAAYSPMPDCGYILLDDTDEQVVLFLDGAITTNQLSFNASWEDYAK